MLKFIIAAALAAIFVHLDSVKNTSTAYKADKKAEMCVPEISMLPFPFEYRVKPEEKI